MNFNREIVMRRILPCDRGGCFAHAETDLEKRGRASAKGTLQIKRFFFEGSAIFRQQRDIRAMLGAGNTALAKDKATDWAMLCHVRDEKNLNYDALVSSVPVELLGTLVTLAIVPVTGELGLAL